MFVIGFVILCFCVLFGCCFVISTNTVDFLESPVPKYPCIEWDVELYTLTADVLATHSSTVEFNIPPNTF